MQIYHFHTIWRISAPADEVWSCIIQSERWADWWPGVKKVVEIHPGNEHGIGSVRQYVFKSPLGYRLHFTIEVTECSNKYFVRGRASGALDGWGTWQLVAGKNGNTEAHCDWQVRTTIPWMNLLEPFMSFAFRWAHARVMSAGERALKQLLLNRSFQFQKLNSIAKAI